MSDVITLLPRMGRRMMAGHPWVYSNEIKMDAAAKAIAAGSIVAVADERGRAIATAHYNPHTLIAARILRDTALPLDDDFWRTRLAAALRLRENLFSEPYYRLVHAEADGLPGLIIDRYNEHIVVQPNTAGMQAALPVIVAALEELVKPASIILRGDTPARALEGLEQEVRVIKGNAPDQLQARENGLSYTVDGMGGQKTGWFYDQRRNRALVAGLAHNKTVLDLYTHTGGFGLLAAHKGAKSVLCVDRSEHALNLAKQTANAAQLKQVAFEKADVFDFCAAYKGPRFDIVVADPPAFAKSRKDVGAASRGYRKLAKMAAALVNPSGFFFIASCSHAITPERFNEEVAAGMREAGRKGAILAHCEADLDHPTHPHLPESSYLKGVLFACS